VGAFGIILLELFEHFTKVVWSDTRAGCGDPFDRKETVAPPSAGGLSPDVSHLVIEPGRRLRVNCSSCLGEFLLPGSAESKLKRCVCFVNAHAGGW
jgi:hypothetical protein